MYIENQRLEGVASFQAQTTTQVYQFFSVWLCMNPCLVDLMLFDSCWTWLNSLRTWFETWCMLIISMNFDISWNQSFLIIWDRLLERGFINSETWRHFFSYGAGAPAFTMTSVRETVGREAGSGGMWLYVSSLFIYVWSGLSSHHFHI